MLDASQGAVHGGAETVDNHVDVVLRRDIGRRQQHVIAAAAIHTAAGRVAGEAAFERRSSYFVVELEGGIERPSRRAILDQFDRLEQAATADVADVTVI